MADDARGPDEKVQDEDPVVTNAGRLALRLLAAASIWRLDQPTPVPGERRSGQVRPVTPAFFQTMGIPFVSGRDFSSSDSVTSAPVAIVSETFVRSHFAGESPVGRQLHINTVPHANGRDDVEWTVVGIVRDILSSSDATAAPIVYVPLTQMPARN